MTAIRRLRWLSLSCFVLAFVLGISLLAPPARAAGDTLQTAFAQAAREFGVPPTVRETGGQPRRLARAARAIAH